VTAFLPQLGKEDIVRQIILFGLLIAVSQRATADSLELRNGHSLECTVLQVRETSILVFHGSAMIPVPRADVVTINRDVAGTEPPSTVERLSTRLPDYPSVAKTVAKRSWATDLKQIPATVINVGAFRNVPYKSHRAGREYEINVYGDPESPAGFEVGLHRAPADGNEAKENCIECVCRLLGDRADQQVVHGLNREKSLTTRNGVTFEITPPTDPDAYGGWWVSVYDEKALDAARATEKEMKSISVARSSLSAATNSNATSAGSKRRDDIDALSAWSPNDLTYARTPTHSARESAPGGQVYVRGYTRKDGTYVQPYTRSAPHTK
jgi:hypothetical protein